MKPIPIENPNEVMSVLRSVRKNISANLIIAISREILGTDETAEIVNTIVEHTKLSIIDQAKSPKDADKVNEVIRVLNTLLIDPENPGNGSYHFKGSDE